MKESAPPNIALVGKSGSGKTTVATYLVERHKYTRASTGDVCREVCRILFADTSKSIMNRVTDALKEVDEDVWLRAALASIGNDHRIVFDSMRFRGDYEFLVAEGFRTWRVDAPLSVRVDRMAARNESYNSSVDELHRTEQELDSISVDVSIQNSLDDLPGLYERIESALKL